MKDFHDFDEEEIWEMEDDRVLAVVVGGLFLATGFLAVLLIWAVFL